jgi:hypothetical protein
VRWGSGAGFDVTIPDSKYGLIGDDLFATVTDPGGNSIFAWEGYQLGLGIELFEFADGSTYALEEVLQQATVERLYGYQFVRGSGSQVIEQEWSSVDFSARPNPALVRGSRSDSTDGVPLRRRHGVRHRRRHAPWPDTDRNCGNRFSRW